MSVFSRLFRSRDKPENKLGATTSFFFGGSNSGKAVNERTAMQTSAVYACVRILSETLASLPLHIYKYIDGGGKEMQTQHYLYPILHDNPNPEMTSFVFRETLMSHLLVWGNAYAQIIRDGRGRVLAMYPLLPNRMSVDRSQNTGQLVYSYIPPVDTVITMGCNVECPFLPCEHREDWGLDDPTGKSDEEFVRIIQLIEKKVLELNKYGKAKSKPTEANPNRGILYQNS